MILVTGGTGLVGSHLIYKLAEKGLQIKALYRSKDKLEAVKHVFSYYTKNVDELFSKIEWVKGDINDIPSLTIAFKNVSRVYHCAALISFDTKDYYKLRRTNIEGTANIVNFCITNSVDKLCYVSSTATIGKSENSSLMTEKSHWNPEESHNVYAITKYGAEMEVWRGTQEGLDSVIVNPGVIIGPGFWHSGSGSLIKRVYKGMSYYTKGVTGFVDVDDVVKPMIELMNGGYSNKRYILVSENLSYQDFFTKTAIHLGVKPPHKEASKALLNIVWRLDWLRSFIRNKRRRLTEHTSQSITKRSRFSSKKIETEINYNFKPIEESITQVSQFFLKDLE